MASFLVHKWGQIKSVYQWMGSTESVNQWMGSTDKDVNLKLARTLQSNNGLNKCSNNQKSKAKKGRDEGKHNESKLLDGSKVPVDNPNSSNHT
jgi:hypothetical protein